MDPNRQDPNAGPPAVGPALALVLGASVIVGFVIGIVPGLVLGFTGLHTIGAPIGAVVWGGWYFYTRWKRAGSVNPVMVAMSVAGGLGVLISVLLFGELTD